MHQVIKVICVICLIVLAIVGIYYAGVFILSLVKASDAGDASDPTSQTSLQTQSQSASIPLITQPTAPPVTIPVTPVVTPPLVQATTTSSQPIPNPIITPTISKPVAAPTLTQPIPITTPEPVVVQAAPVIQLVSIPAWCQKANHEGISVDQSILLPVVITSLQATADTQKVNIKGQMSLVSGSYRLEGTVQNKQVAIDVYDSQGAKTLQMIGQESAAGDQVVLQAGTVKITIQPTQQSNAFTLAKQMEGFFVLGCKRQPFIVSNTIVINDQIVLQGSDSNGKWTLFGTGKVTANQITVELRKMYTSDSKPTNVFRGTIVSGVTSGQWETVSNGSDKSEFRMYPVGTTLSEDIPLYGNGCQYPTNWKGAFLFDGDSFEYPMQVSNFKVDSALNITGDIADQWGSSKLSGSALGRNFKANKAYNDPKLGVVQQIGTISLQRIQGTWDNTQSTGTFYYTPV